MREFNLWQRIEGAGVFVAALTLYLMTPSDFSWWAAIIIFFAPDIAFAAYIMSPAIGAFAYNTVHIYAFGAAALAIGALTSEALIVALGALWLAHSGFDRMLGYGLKARTGFKHTHMGNLG